MASLSARPTERITPERPIHVGLEADDKPAVYQEHHQARNMVKIGNYNH